MILPLTELAQRHCRPCEGGVPPLDHARIAELLAGLPGWQYLNGRLAKTYRFRNYHETMAFVNAVAYVAHREDHHPDLEVGYNHCTVHYSTHAIHGLSDNDFICAARVEDLTA